MNKHLKVHSIYNSISGEIGLIRQGTPATFLRLIGCNMNCPYCDSMDAVKGKYKVELDIEDCVNKVFHLFQRTKNLIITGGEPLLQKMELFAFLQGLITTSLNTFENSGIIQVETNGTITTDPLDKLVSCWVVDHKTSNSNITSLMRKNCDTSHTKDLFNNFILRTSTYIKYVCGSICDIEDAFIHINNTMLAFGGYIKANPAFAKIAESYLPRFGIGVEYGNEPLLSKLLDMFQNSPLSPLNRKELINAKGLMMLNVQLHKIIGIGKTEEVPLKITTNLD